MMIMNHRSRGNTPSVDSRARHGRVDAIQVARAAAAPGRPTRRVRDASIPIATHATARSRSPRAIHSVVASTLRGIRANGSTTRAITTPAMRRAAATPRARMPRPVVVAMHPRYRPAPVHFCGG